MTGNTEEVHVLGLETAYAEKSSWPATHHLKVATLCIKSLPASGPDIKFHSELVT